MSYAPEHIEEAAVLGAMLLLGRGPWPDEVSILRPEYFCEPRHRRAFGVMQEMIENGEPIDEITVAHRLKDYGAGGQFAYLNALASDCPTAVNLSHWARIVLERGRNRVLDAEMAEIVGSNCTADEKMLRMRQAAERAACATVVAGLEPVREYVAAEIRQLEAEAGEGDSVGSVIRTMIPKLDRKVQLRPGQLTIIAGRPGMGKSALAGTIAANIAKRADSSVALFSLEMSRSDYIRRLLAGEARASSRDLAGLAAAGGLTEPAERVYGLDLWVDERAKLTTQEIRATLLRRLPNCRLVIVDYLQLTDMGKIGERHDLQVGEVTKGLRAIAKDFNCHVMALSQLNRNVERRNPPKPQLSDLRDSGNIEEDADHVWLLFRPGYYGMPAPEGEAEVIVGKQRGGEIGPVSLTFFPERSRFEERANHNEEDRCHA